MQTLSHADARKPEFWNNRLAATDPPLEASQTQIPLIPDQTEFLERWFEFHQGYRIVKHADGTESRIAVLGEPFREVSPGFLPRTLNQLRAGIENDEFRPQNRFRRRRLSSEEERAEEPQQSLEEALDSLLEDASDEETADTEHQESDMPRDATGLSRPLTRTEVHLHRAMDRIARIFGTREDVQRDDYESPLSTMYDRAWGRYEQAEERRASGDTTAPSVEGLSGRDRREIEEQVLWGVMDDSRDAFIQEQESGNVRSYTPASMNRRSEDSATEPTTPRTFESFVNLPTNAPPSASLTTTSSASTSTNDLRTSLEQITSDLTRLRMASEAVANARHAIHARRHPAPLMTLDNQPDRPAPMTDEQMTKNLSCQVCYCQIADIAVLPCGHMVMCQWCADVVVPVRHSHLPVSPSKCPMCRKPVKQRFKIHMGS